MIVVDLQPRLEHRVTINEKSAVEIERICTWCHEQFGQRFSIADRENFGRDGVWQCLWKGLDSSTYHSAGYEFSFDYEQDAVLFALRWG